MKLPNAHLAIVEQEKIIWIRPPLRGRRFTRNTWRAHAPGSDGVAAQPRRSCTTADHRVPFGSGMMMSEHDCVVLTQDVPEAGLEAGDVGTVVHLHAGGAGYEVEFMTLAGETLAVVTLRPAQVRPIQPRDVAHVRQLAATSP